MATRESKKQKELDPILQQLGVYVCANCHRQLLLEKVLVADVERREGTATGYIRFEHRCACSSTGVLETRALGSYPSFRALFGGQPTFPYRAPFAWRDVDDDDPSVTRWAWELGQVADWQDFMLFAEDAANRPAA